ncbi:MAG: NAD(P)-dependent oxidoreductase [Elusimicrobiota bacterium]|jgi:nucleoside-diphosphate-sugar epimerase|nr:NAD(P)-dependent oxidoreductase [Elusimicrobiota bacterium]
MKILLTGANGFVGSHIAKELTDNNNEVICLIRPTSNLSWLEGLDLSYRKASFNNKEELKSCVRDIDIVVHCAGLVRAINKEEYFEVNVENTKRLCEAVLSENPNLKKFIFISSQAAMGPSKSQNPKSLDENENPVSDYGLSKLAAEKEIKKLLSGKIPYTILRPASVYGPRDKDIFIFFNLVHKHFKPMTLKKRFLQLVFVEDIAKAVISALNNSKSDNKTFFLAQKTPYKWADIAEIIAKGAKKKVFPLPLPDFAFYIAAFIAENLAKISKKPAVLNKQKINEMLQTYWIGDTAPAERDLGLIFTSLEKGSQKTYNWYMNSKRF